MRWKQGNWKRCSFHLHLFFVIYLINKLKTFRNFVVMIAASEISMELNAVQIQWNRFLLILTYKLFQLAILK